MSCPIPAIEDLEDLRVAERIGLANHGPRTDHSDGQPRLAYADWTIDAYIPA